MEETIFCNKKALQIVSHETINDIKSLIKNIGSFNICSKYYSFLNRKNINNLKEGRYNISLSTFGKKFVMFITNYKNEKYCIFINKKNENMIITQLDFCNNEIFNGSLFEGELVKSEDRKWLFLINDVMYYKGVNIVTKKFNERQDIINNFLSNEYKKNERFNLCIKEHYSIPYFLENYIELLKNKSAGLFFKNIDNFCSNYLYIFPENRTDSKILQGGTIIDNIKHNITTTINFNNNQNQYKENEEKVPYIISEELTLIEEKEKDNVKEILESQIKEAVQEKVDSDDEFEEVLPYNIQNSNIKISEENDSKVVKKNIIIKKSDVLNNKELKLDKITCKFLIMSTPLPETYNLYCKGNNGSIDKHSLASVPNMDTSNYLNILFKNNTDNNTKIYVECNYHKNFKKWIPYKITDSMDTLETINKIQIILDSQ
jgi:hypothetical protein